jgi:hypothetical protein
MARRRYHLHFCEVVVVVVAVVVVVVALVVVVVVQWVRGYSAAGA